ncbi:butyrophilin subfamily 2 member A2-like [Silurus meridionalis]|nr:butyrophilin subfamily 2 member A2-like [Silurus meridionalis]
MIVDRGGSLALMSLLHVLAATCLFKHPKHLPDFFHIMVYMFGAVGLSTINSIVLATELILKAGKGVRNIEDLCTIVLPLETLSVSAWLILQIYDACSLPLEDLQVEWRKTDTDYLVSLFQQGKSRPDLQTQVFRDRAEFFPDEVPKGNFSILLKNVVKDDVGVYRCQVNTTQDTGQVIMEIKEIGM